MADSADARPLGGARTGDATRSCTDCGKHLCSRNVVGLCKRCCGLRSGGRSRKHPKRFCSVCAKPVRGESGLCRTHFVAMRLSTPEAAEKRREGIRRYVEQNPEKLAAHGSRNLRKLWADPAFRERTKARTREIQPLGQKASQTLESRARAGRAVTERRLGWCPVAYRDDYRALVKRIGAAAARVEIKQRVAADRAKAKRALTFEEKLERVRTGQARIVEKVPVPQRTHDFTLGGISAGML